MSTIQSALLLTLTQYEKKLVLGEKLVTVHNQKPKTAPITERYNVAAAKFMQRLKDNNIPFALSLRRGERLSRAKLLFPVILFDDEAV